MPDLSKTYYKIALEAMDTRDYAVIRQYTYCRRLEKRLDEAESLMNRWREMAIREAAQGDTNRAYTLRECAYELELVLQSRQHEK